MLLLKIFKEVLPILHISELLKLARKHWIFHNLCNTFIFSLLKILKFDIKFGHSLTVDSNNLIDSFDLVAKMLELWIFLLV